MADVISLFPEGNDACSYTIRFDDGSSVTIAVPKGDRLTIAHAIFLLEDAKFAILSHGS